ncbi:hypothetical protein ml_101 [Mollivirus sibericum]|uniref:hypothetical protein n=1 Tax=Mollivirus sibericum TaxID=1678078 RepID=UPI0006B2DC8F|nr:hypothetical protein ml_101 [Mollivirus sibericum]ALD61903.1 hypothetical protein ml_101 [Mollivirus sibericum]
MTQIRPDQGKSSMAEQQQQQQQHGEEPGNERKGDPNWLSRIERCLGRISPKDNEREEEQTDRAKPKPKMTEAHRRLCLALAAVAALVIGASYGYMRRMGHEGPLDLIEGSEDEPPEAKELREILNDIIMETSKTVSAKPSRDRPKNGNETGPA